MAGRNAKLMVRVFRLRKGLTQQELAEKANVSQSMISGLESGRLNITYDKLKRIADVLGVASVDQLMQQTGDS